MDENVSKKNSLGNGLFKGTIFTPAARKAKMKESQKLLHDLLIIQDVIVVLNMSENLNQVEAPEVEHLKL